MTVFQRVFGFFYPMQSVASTLGVFGVLGYLISFLCGISAAQYSNDEELKSLVRLSCLTHLFYFVRLCQISVLGGVAATFREMVSSHFLIPCKLLSPYSLAIDTNTHLKTSPTITGRHFSSLDG